MDPLVLDWREVLKQLFSASAIAAAFSFVFKKYTEKRIDNAFERQMKLFEARLKEVTALREGLGKDRIAEYKKLIGALKGVRKQALEVADLAAPASNDVAALRSRAKALEAMLYEQAMTLQLDGFYDQVHAYKVGMVQLSQMLENERKLRDIGQSERAAGVREAIRSSLEKLNQDNQVVIESLVNVVKTATTL